MKTVKHTTTERRAIETAYFLMLEQIGAGTEAARWTDKVALPYYRKAWGVSSRVAAMAGLLDFYHEGQTNGRVYSIATYWSYDPVSIKLIALGAQYGDQNRTEIAEALDAQGQYRERQFEASCAEFEAKHGKVA